MSAIRTLFWERFHVRTLSVVAALLAWQSSDVFGESYSSYGARMCADAGIPPDECTLTTEPVFVEPEPAPATSKNTKAATLADHARRLCEQEGVPEEDCVALPTDQRPGADIVPAASPFLTVPSSVPVVEVATAPVVAAPPIPVQRPSVRQIAPSPPAERAVRVVRAPPPFDPRLRVVEQTGLPVDQGFREVGAPLVAADPMFREVGPPFAPVDLGFGRVRQPVPDDPAFREFEPAFVPVDRGFRRVREPSPPAPVFREVDSFDAPPPSRGFGIAEFFGFGGDRSDVVAFEERGDFFEESETFFQERRGRCFREVRYSAPPSYRFVTC